MLLLLTRIVGLRMYMYISWYSCYHHSLMNQQKKHLTVHIYTSTYGLCYHKKILKVFKHDYWRNFTKKEKFIFLISESYLYVIYFARRSLTSPIKCINFISLRTILYELFFKTDRPIFFLNRKRNKNKNHFIK